jgi:hypothetical protein
MKRSSKLAIVVLALLCMVALPLIDHAYADAIYNIPAIKAISTYAEGEVYIRWEGLPNPGPCGNNNNWVVIPSTANEALKALALSVYFSGRPAQIHTAGCSGFDNRYESVKAIYSPEG